MHMHMRTRIYMRVIGIYILCVYICTYYSYVDDTIDIDIDGVFIIFLFIYS